MCSSQKREQNDPPDPVQSLPQDQRQAGRYQQHPSAKYSVSRTHGHYVLICPFVKKIVSKENYTRDTRVIKKEKYKCTCKFPKENFKFMTIFEIPFRKNFIVSSVFMNMYVNNLVKSDRNDYMT